jgi:FKBP-type peptidyl-prolyl cis-trans isomerase SlyD
MKIEENKVVGMHYTLKNKMGQVLDTSEGQEPLYFIQGIGNIIPGLESALEGKKTGDKFNVSVEPSQAYGEYSAEMVLEIAREELAHIDGLAEGMRLQSENEDGQMAVLKVTKITEETVTVDGNHELAGMHLHFDGEIVEVREAAPEELEHGHVHGPGGHHH